MSILFTFHWVEHCESPWSSTLRSIVPLLIHWQCQYTAVHCRTTFRCVFIQSAAHTPTSLHTHTHTHTASLPSLSNAPSSSISLSHSQSLAQSSCFGRALEQSRVCVCCGVCVQSSDRSGNGERERETDRKGERVKEREPSRGRTERTERNITPHHREYCTRSSPFTHSELLCCFELTELGCV